MTAHQLHIHASYTLHTPYSHDALVSNPWVVHRPQPLQNAVMQVPGMCYARGFVARHPQQRTIVIRERPSGGTLWSGAVIGILRFGKGTLPPFTLPCSAASSLWNSSAGRLPRDSYVSFSSGIAVHKCLMCSARIAMCATALLMVRPLQAGRGDVYRPPPLCSTQN